MSGHSKIFAPKKAASDAPLAPATPLFTTKERHLLGRLGLSRDTLRALRATHLREDVDWRMVGRDVMLTDDAVAKIAAAAQLQPADLPRTVRGLLTFPGWPGTECVLKAWRFWPRLNNRKVVEAYHRGSDPNDRRNIVTVRVTDAANFVPHMEIPARLVPGHSALYECTRPAPRSRGRW